MPLLHLTIYYITPAKLHLTNTSPYKTSRYQYHAIPYYTALHYTVPKRCLTIPLPHSTQHHQDFTKRCQSNTPYYATSLNLHDTILHGTLPILHFTALYHHPTVPYSTCTLLYLTLPALYSTLPTHYFTTHNHYLHRSPLYIHNTTLIYNLKSPEPAIPELPQPHILPIAQYSRNRIPGNLFMLKQSNREF